MSLSDVMSGMGSSVFAQAAFVLASAAFLTVLVTLFLGRNRAAFERARFLPLEDDSGERRGGDGGSRTREAASHE